MYTIKKLFREHSWYLLFLTLIEGILAVLVTLSFVYTDSLTYTASNILSGIGVDELLQTMYTSTWWALILLLLFFIVIFNLVTIVYKKIEFGFISICCIVAMMILAINLGNPITDIISKLALFIPIIGLSIIAYKTERDKLLELAEKKKEKEEKPTKKTTTKKTQKNKASK